MNDSSHSIWELPVNDLVSIVIHTTVNFIAIFENILLFLAITFRTPSSQRSYAVLLYNSAIIDLLAALNSFLAMTRLMPVGDMVAYIYDGPCALVSGFFCHCTLTVTFATSSQSIYLIASSFAFRLYSLERGTPLSRQVLVVCLLTSIPNLIVLTTFLFAIDDSTEVRRAFSILRPEYELDDKTMEGHLNIYNPSVMFTILAMTIPIGPLLVATFVLRTKVLAKIREKSTEMSTRTSKLHSAFTKVLSLQSILPIFFSISVICYLLCQTDTVCTPVMEHSISVAASICPCLSPGITLFFVQPYRAFVEEKICRMGKRKIQGVETSVSEHTARKVSTFSRKVSTF